ncbi:MAG: hypothetical protein ACON5N_07170 [Akkermansiaceae bacterium]
MDHPLVIVGFFLLVFPLFWALVLKIIARFGWSKLARSYPARRQPVKSGTGWQSMILGRMIGYNNCLTFRATSKRLHLSLPLIFRPGHPPLLIPWEDFHLKREGGSLFGKKYVYEIGDPSITRMTIGERIHQAIKSHAMA